MITAEQHKNSLAYRSRLHSMRDMARVNLSQRDFGCFEQSLEPLLNAVETEIRAYEQTINSFACPAWKNLGEFVVNARISQPAGQATAWDASQCPVNVSISHWKIAAGELPLFLEPTLVAEDNIAAGSTCSSLSSEAAQVLELVA
jgi:hypothetical protein